MFGNGVTQFGGYGQPMNYGQQYQPGQYQQMPMQQTQYQQPMQFQATEPVQQMPTAMPVTLQNVVDMMGQMLQELAAIREAMKHE